MTAPSGKITALVGRNGAGKTTLIRKLLREAPKEDLRRGRVGLVPQEPTFAPGMTVEESLLLAYLPCLGVFAAPVPSMHDEVRRMAIDLGVEGFLKRRLETLSSGERQRVLLGRALLQRPKLLLLDEPTNHLDPWAVARFWEKLALEQARTGVTIVVSTHDMAFVEKYAAHVVALENGKVRFEGPTEVFGKTVLPELFKAAW